MERLLRNWEQDVWLLRKIKIYVIMIWQDWLIDHLTNLMVSRIILSTSKSHLKDIVKINHFSAESAALTTLMAVQKV